MLSQKSKQVIVADSAMSARCAIRGKQALLDPIDHGSRIYVQEPTDFVCRVDGLTAALGLVHHAGQESLPCCLYIQVPLSLLHCSCRGKTVFISVYSEIRNGNKHTRMES